MHDFSTVDGFVEITEDLSDMIKFVANEPSVGLFYIQQHTRNATPNLLNLKNNIVKKSHETALQAEDLEDSITMLRSMKECGVPIADEMIKDIKKSLSVVSTKQPKRGLLHSSSATGFLGRTSSWSPATWGQNSLFAQQDSEKRSSGYLSGIFRSAKQTDDNLKPAQVESEEAGRSEPWSDLDPTVASTSKSSLTVPEAEAAAEDLPVSSELREESQLSKNSSHQRLLSLYEENYDEFKADREAKLEEWLGETGNEVDRAVRTLD
ncbi:hypothetical protein PHJA_001579500 [Phtheirospermum japonicum]|uniref:Uncharacterized protein n=1 Tax=Phtheirospermum japonicum TaxID=374723 RepID=A0A830C3Z1_9LAMI|nr:hypothetical protein PHJA_001579500 [Phtheirospermum japonicum]